MQTMGMWLELMFKMRESQERAEFMKKMKVIGR